MHLRPQNRIAQLGVYEPGRPMEEVARELGLRADSMVKLASNENLLGPSPKALAAMAAAAGQMHLYPDGGSFYLRERIAAKLEVEPACIVPGNGSNELIELLGHVFLGPGTSIVMSERAFVVYRLVSALFQGETLAAPEVNYGHDPEALLAAIRPDTRLLFIANPNNPTGTMLGAEEMDRLLDRVPPDVLAVVDEAYIEVVEPSLQPRLLGRIRAGQPLCILRTFSKAYGLAGLRLGYAVCPPELAGLLNRVRQPFNVNAMAQAAALAALDDEEHLIRTRRMTREGLAQIAQACDARGLACVPSVANFVLIQTGRGREVFNRLLPHGVIVRPVDGYGLLEHIRVTVGTREQNERFIAALDEVLAGLREGASA